MKVNDKLLNSITEKNWGFSSTDHWKTSYHVICATFSRLLRYKGIGKVVAYILRKYLKPTSLSQNSKW